MPAVLVFCEVKDGKLKKTSREALAAASSLTGAGEVVAVAAGSGARSVAADAGNHGAKKLLVAEDASLDQYTTESMTAVVKAAVEASGANVVIIPGTSNGRDLAPRLAARLDAGVASDVVSLEWKEGKLIARRPLYSGKAFATVEIDGPVAIATTRPNSFPPREGSAAEAAVETLNVGQTSSRTKVLETKISEGDELTIAEADIIVSGGRGLKEAENFKYVKDLAHAINGAVGASRAVVDAGWIDHHHQVGQTGRVVSPNLYIAAGISGAIQHLAGMSSSRHIIAINKDPEAPIFRAADLGVVGDLFAILPALTEEVKAAKSHH
jgi:electron transfer flavoprotein alpha subunit